LDDAVVELKRGETFIRAISFVIKKIPGAKFLIIGRRGSAYERLKNLIKELGVVENITLLEPMPNAEIPLWLSRSLCYVQISDTETFGMSVAEAMACETPVVVSHKGALPEIVGKDGTYVNHNDAISVASGIMEVLAMDHDRRGQVGAELRRRIVQNFSYKRRKQSFSRIINELI
jgi:glycosyltransferase involved in cell wall biosynthesis